MPYKVMNKKGSVLFRITLIIISIVALILGDYLFKKQSYVASEFKKVDGSVASSWVDALKEERTQFGIRVTRYYPRIVYKYIVGNGTFTSSSLAEPEIAGFDTRKDAEKFLTPYYPEAKCTVYYDPRNPSRAVLFKRSPYVQIIYFVITIIILGIVIFYRPKRKLPPETPDK